MQKILELKNFSMQYPVSIDLPELAYSEAAVVTVEGDSGVGKSSFFRALVGLEKASTGLLKVNGQDLTADFSQIRKNILYIPQAPLTAKCKVLEFFIEISKFNPEFNISNFDLLDTLGLELLEKDISSLSGGENQLVKLEIMLALNPVIVIFDEVFTGIDGKKLVLIEEVLKDWLKQRLVFNIHHAPTILDKYSSQKLIFSKRKGRIEIATQNMI